jgi:hypothetical protein
MGYPKRRLDISCVSLLVWWLSSFQTYKKYINWVFVQENKVSLDASFHSFWNFDDALVRKNYENDVLEVKR